MAKRTRRVVDRGDGFIEERKTATGETRIRARYPDPDKPGTYRSVTRPDWTWDDAADFLINRGIKVRNGVIVASPDMTMQEAFDECLARWSREISPRTQYNYRGVFKSMIAPHLGRRKVTELKPIDIQRWHDRMHAAGFAASSILTGHRVISHVFNDLHRLDVLDRNPARNIRAGSLKRIKRDVWDAAQVKQVIAYVVDVPVFGALYAIAFETGMRPSELRALRWQDVSFERREILVRGTISRDGENREIMQSHTKTREERAIAVSQNLLDVLQRHRVFQKTQQLKALPWESLDLIITRSDGHWLGRDTWRRFHMKMCGELGIPVIRLHDLRHTYATRLLELGVPWKVVSEALGHSSVQITMDLYSHVSSELQRSTQSLLAATLYDETGTD